MLRVRRIALHSEYRIAVSMCWWLEDSSRFSYLDVKLDSLENRVLLTEGTSSRNVRAFSCPAREFQAMAHQFLYVIPEILTLVASVALPAVELCKFGEGSRTIYFRHRMKASTSVLQRMQGNI